MRAAPDDPEPYRRLERIEFVKPAKEPTTLVAIADVASLALVQHQVKNLPAQYGAVGADIFHYYRLPM